MNMLALFSRDLGKGSSKYRLAQYIEYFKTRELNVKLVNRDDINKALIKEVRHFDILLNQRYLFDYSLARRLIENSKRVIFDFDDAIYTRPGKPYSLIAGIRVRTRMNLWLKKSDVVTTSSNFLLKYAQKYSDSVKVVPMSLDLDLWKPSEKISDNSITIGWAGAPVNINLIERIDEILSQLLIKYPFIRLAIFSGQKPELSCPFEYHPFQHGMEPAFIRDIDIGLLPLNDDEFYKGKSPIKAIQYIACGIPVVGNVIGATGEILTSENSITVSDRKEWFDALETLVLRRDLLKSMGIAGRRQAEKKFNFKTVADNFYNILSGN
ncbi:MAG: glycosyltransferase family 4 protein [Proteobacteria bacterium]|nr:glycosyltransferase family 4 protein [Pseudomonadota bacterium]MBU1711636.1 glycosyltransferase family 4 protein [Pseudomonadota bacterium]